MDLSCIILSGDLELYVLGMLPEDEAYKIAQLALLFPEIQEELDRISASLQQVAEVSQLAPSPSVKTNLMKRLQALKEEEDASATPVVPIQTGRQLSISDDHKEINQEPAPVVSMQKESALRYWLPAAALIGVLLSLGGVIFLASKNREYRDEMATMQQSVRSLNRQVVTLQRDNLAASQMVEMLQSDAYKKIRLTAVPGKPEALAQVFWNTQTREVFINDVSLPKTPAGKQYQLWAIVDGKPVDAGMLSDTKNRVQQMKRFERADAFAITLERAGGSPTPTLEAMVVMGGAS